MLTKVDDFRIIFTVITALTAYVIGTINFAASCVAFGYLEKTSQDEVMLVSQIESLQQPQVLKETLELLHVKRTLVVFIFPLVWFGAALAWDTYENYFTDGVRIGAGTALVALAILAYVFAVRMTRLLNTTARRLLADVPNKTPDPPNYDL